MRATRIAISGLSSNVGKTTLLCELLKRNPGWEAIKVSRGHYRSCGRSREACCISPLLGSRPLILSGRAETFTRGKDTGRYWQAGASNVHWVICTSEQVEEGVEGALERVESEGVLIEGTSLLKCIPVDLSIMVVNPSSEEIKTSAAKAIASVNAIYMSESEGAAERLMRLRDRLMRRGQTLGEVPVYEDLSRLAELIGSVHLARHNGSNIPVGRAGKSLSE